MTALHTGETIWTMSAHYAKCEPPKVFIVQCTVLDGENRVLRQHWGNGHTAVQVLDGVMGGIISTHASEADAWQAAAAAFSRGSEELAKKADECSRKAAACVVGEAVPS